MSQNIQLISACAFSLLTGIYIGQLYFSKKPTKRRSTKLRKSKTPSSPASDGIIQSDDTQTTYDDEDSDYASSSDIEESEEEDYQVNSTSLNDIPGETRMALVVRTDLKMTKGKAAAQCAHAALGCYRLMLQDGNESQNLTLLKRWERTGQAKITLQVRSKEDMDLLFAQAISLNINSYIVHDAGRTQIEAGSATVLGLGPAPKIILDQVTGDLKLY